MKYRQLIIFFLVVIALQLLSAMVIMMYFKTWEDRNSFGGMFGAVNTLFSGLAFAGVIFTIMIQSKELELQRIELRQSREQFQMSNGLAKMELLNHYFGRYDSDNFKKVRKSAAALLSSGTILPVDDPTITSPIDEVLNLLQEVGIAQKHGILESRFVAGRFGGLSRCYYGASLEYIKSVREVYGNEIWESIEDLVNKSMETVKMNIDAREIQNFLKREARLSEI